MELLEIIYQIVEHFLQVSAPVGTLSVSCYVKKPIFDGVSAAD